MSGLLTVAQARAQILRDARPLPGEEAAPGAAHGRTLARPLAAAWSQPPFDCAAMDGYAVRGGQAGGTQLTLAAPPPHDGAAGTLPPALAPGQAARIFTGAPLPAGADTVVMQEKTHATGGHVVMDDAVSAGAHVRRTGLDFRAGDICLPAGRRLRAADVALAAAAGGRPWVHRRPRAAVLATGSELVPPGSTPGPAQIVSSLGVGLAALLAARGCSVRDLGIACDDEGRLHDALGNALARGAGQDPPDLLITTGGVSVGAHDLVPAALARLGARIVFHGVAMRPGRPLLHARLDLPAGAVSGPPPAPVLILALPGNPVSALVCAHVFVPPLLARLTGRREEQSRWRQARLHGSLPGNGPQELYLRACHRGPRHGAPGVVQPLALDRQDSAVLTGLAAAGVLLRRPPHAPPAQDGDVVEILPLGI